MRFLPFIFFLSLSFSHFIYSEPLKLSVNADSAILINADTGAILYQKNPHAVLYPASITKVATAAYALHIGGNQLNKVITADLEALVSISEDAKRRSNYSQPAYWLVPGGTHIGIKKGEQLKLKDLLFGMMVASGNDAANVVAQDLGGTIPQFMEKLNAYVKTLGCQKTSFYNPSGLHHPKHVTTANDMALITREALKNPSFCEIVSTIRFTRPKTNKQEATVLVQTNKLLKPGKHHYSKAIGVKTGYTSQAQNTFVAAARNDGRTLIAVMLKTKEREDIFKDATKLFEAAFNQPKVQRTVAKAGPQKYALEHEGTAKSISTYIEENFILEYYPAEEPSVKGLIYWDAIKLPVAKGQKIGELQIQTDDGKTLHSAPLLAQEDVKSTWSYWFKSFFK